MMFNLNRDKVMDLKEYVIKALTRKLFYDEFWALKDISFNVAKGEVMGIMGLNGSGKSTLLKLIAGVFKPTKGSITINGTIAPLLELGAGFDLEFSAKENVFMNGAMFGHPPAFMKTLYNDIMDFAELWEFEDVPIKNFSSGMVARLGFAIAAQVEPDILILDEVLGVGDYLFFQKCDDYIQKLIDNGTTVLLVSHSAATIKNMCSRAVLLHDGQIVCVGSADEVCAIYQPNEDGTQPEI